MTENHLDTTLGTTLFPNGNQASLVHIAVDVHPDAILKKLRITLPHAFILLSAGFDKLDENAQLRLRQLIGRGIVRAAEEIGISFITRGGESEINTMLGQSIAERERQLLLIGVVPDHGVTFPEKNTSEQTQLISLESHHTHFLLVDTAYWEKRTETLFRFINGIIHQQIPLITLLVNGDGTSRLEILRSVRLGIPIVVIEGTGALADELAILYRNPPDFIPDSVLAEIIADGNIQLFSIEGTPADLERLIHRQLWGDNTLKLAWEIFGFYDTNASRHQTHFQQIQLWILGLGILVTFLAIFQKTLEHYTESVQLAQLQTERTITTPSTQTGPDLFNETLKVTPPALSSNLESQPPPLSSPPNLLSLLWQLITDFFTNIAKWFEPFMPALVEILRYVIMAIPIVITTLIAATNRFNSGKKWLNLRASAEQIKREIFCYRAQAMSYSPPQVKDKTPEIQLAEQVQNIAYNLMQTEVNVSALRPYPHGIQQYVAKGDDGISLLTPERYLKSRLEDQFFYYIGKARKLERQLTLLQSTIYVIGGISTLLAALGLELWIALTTTMVTALGSFVEYRQIEKSLMNVNQAATDLANIRSWWTALSSVERTKQANIDLLVDRTERVLQGEFSSWVQEMQEALEALREQQTKESEKKREDNQSSTVSDKQSIVIADDPHQPDKSE